MEIKEITRLAFLKYRLSGKKAMNTFIFTQAKNNKLTDTEINKILKTLDTKIKNYIEQQKKYEIKTYEKIDFTCNIF